MSSPRVALVHDWLTGMRGGERVLLELSRLFPDAPIYTLLWNRGTVDPEIEQRVVGTSWLQQAPFSAGGYRNYLPLFPAAIRSIRIGEADLVLSSSHAVAKAVRTPPGARHVSYVHTPMRYAWGFGGNYFPGGGAVRRLALECVAPYLRRFDKRSTRRVDLLIANSANVQRRIQDVYQRAADVIHPPVDTDFFHPGPTAEEGSYYLLVSSLEPYKRVDVALEAFRRLDRRLVVVGTGTLAGRLARDAPPNVELFGRVDDERLRRLYQGCRALVFPADEDFGMVPVEAQACGKPAICFRKGGAVESVIEGETGLFFEEQEPSALAESVRRFETMDWDSEPIRRNSLRFSRTVFRDKMQVFFRSRLDLAIPA